MTPEIRDLVVFILSGKLINLILLTLPITGSTASVSIKGLIRLEQDSESFD